MTLSGQGTCKQTTLPITGVTGSVGVSIHGPGAIRTRDLLLRRVSRASVSVNHRQPTVENQRLTRSGVSWRQPESGGLLPGTLPARRQWGIPDDWNPPISGVHTSAELDSAHRQGAPRGGSQALLLEGGDPSAKL